MEDEMKVKAFAWITANAYNAKYSTIGSTKFQVNTFEEMALGKHF